MKFDLTAALSAAFKSLNQEDARELFSKLFGALYGPLVPVVMRTVNAAYRAGFHLDDDRGVSESPDGKETDSHDRPEDQSEERPQDKRDSKAGLGKGSGSYPNIQR